MITHYYITKSKIFIFTDITSEKENKMAMEIRVLLLITSAIVLCFVCQTVILNIRMTKNLDDLTKRIDERVTENLEEKQKYILNEMILKSIQES